MKALTILAIPALYFLTGCAAIEPVSVSGPSGQQAYTMKCSGLGRTIEMCYQKSGEICPSGYNVVNQSDSLYSIPQVDAPPLVGTKTNLTIECK